MSDAPTTEFTYTAFWHRGEMAAPQHAAALAERLRGLDARAEAAPDVIELRGRFDELLARREAAVGELEEARAEAERAAAAIQGAMLAGTDERRLTTARHAAQTAHGRAETKLEDLTAAVREASARLQKARTAAWERERKALVSELGAEQDRLSGRLLQIDIEFERTKKAAELSARIDLTGSPDGSPDAFRGALDTLRVTRPPTAAPWHPPAPRSRSPRA